MNDKVLHLYAGILLASLGGILTAFPPELSALILAITIGAGKEIMDKYRGGTPDVLDFIATVCGGFIIVVILLIV